LSEARTSSQQLATVELDEQEEDRAKLKKIKSQALKCS
jgi:hypothetical protein